MLRTSPRRASRIAAIAVVGAAALTAAAFTAPAAMAATANHSSSTTTPIKHVVVLFDENVSFDHYFGTYPQAANTDGTTFTAAKGTPKVNNLVSSNTLTKNPNQYKPQRLSPAEADTCDQNHSYAPEQKAVNGGKMDKFVQYTNNSTCTDPQYSAPGLVMDYYDGNTVTAEWNYAQNYAMSDNSWDATFGPSTVGALNLVSGQTYGVTSYDPTSTTNPKKLATPDSYTVAAPNSKGVGTVNADPDPVYDDCADSDHASGYPVAGMTGKNVGDLLNAKGVTWGWFQGGFKPTTTAAKSTTGYALCDATSTNIVGQQVLDYSAHHDPFEYYKSTANPHHLAPKTEKEIGKNGQANHQYDLSLFDTAIKDGNLPAVSFLKAPEAEDGHASYSDPTDEQKFLTSEINTIEKSKYWSSTAIIISYDDSDGWYDHQAPTILNGSKDAATDTTLCTTAASKVGVLAGDEDRCGPSQRLPLLVISPYAKKNYVDTTRTTQPSILKFIEDNWHTGTIGGGSFDKTAGTIDHMFDFAKPQQTRVILGSNGAVTAVTKTHITTPTTTSLKLNKAKQRVGGSAIKATAHVTGVSGAPKISGTVSFYVDGKLKKSVKVGSAGTATYKLSSALKTGHHTVKAYFKGGSTTQASSHSASAKLTVVKK